MAEGRGRKESFELTDESKKSSGNSSDKIKMEVEELAKKKSLTPTDISKLSKKYEDDETIIDEILRLYSKRSTEVRRQAKRIAEKIYRNFSEGKRSLHSILNKMMKYKIKHKWTDVEYDELRKELSHLLSGTQAMEIDYNQNIMAFRSRINRALGDTRLTIDDGLKVKDNELGVVGEIISMYDSSLYIHKSVVMSSLMYEDCSLVAMTGKFKKERHLPTNYIHPLIACMFLPKFDIFEFQMLYSNFGSIIKSRNEKKPIMDEPNYLLFDSMISDPNDVVCEVTSPITDIRNRYKVQISLWKLVLHLRSGNYYEGESISEFLQTLNLCRNNLYDNADLAYNQDEGAMLRRLLSVFSLRPTFIYTKPISSIASFTATPYGASLGFNLGQNMQSFGNQAFVSQPIHTVTSISMITLQIPPFYNAGEPTIDLLSAAQQTIWINENKVIVPKQQSIIYSKEVLIFYVNRRIQRIQIRTFSNPLTFSQLPLTMSNFERLNSYPINIRDRLTFRSVEETYHLRSVVAVTETEIKQGDNPPTGIITGCTGLIMSHRNIERGIYDPKYYLYDPFGASLPVKNPDDGGYTQNNPISYIEPFFQAPLESTGGVANKPFFQRASETGTIFIYAKPGGYIQNDLIAI
ncbi:MAG: putative core protein [Satyrvirus sp.]|uniref:Putative core protein n=1 Tax=Satyrvirus sp. TaxID=2487771 RepID=A0A3G5AEJ4_9VIRU|nr:MAG: putative core protein [Satyrvirus sp.]